MEIKDREKMRGEIEDLIENEENKLFEIQEQFECGSLERFVQEHRLQAIKDIKNREADLTAKCEELEKENKDRQDTENSLTKWIDDVSAELDKVKKDLLIQSDANYALLERNEELSVKYEYEVEQNIKVKKENEELKEDFEKVLVEKKKWMMDAQKMYGKLQALKSSIENAELPEKKGWEYGTNETDENYSYGFNQAIDQYSLVVAKKDARIKELEEENTNLDEISGGLEKHNAHLEGLLDRERLENILTKRGLFSTKGLLGAILGEEK